MKHARADYDRIQDPAGRIPNDEPVMLFRAQDKHFVSVLRYYRELVAKDNGDPRILHAVAEHIERARKWPKKKAPDMPAAVSAAGEQK